MTKARLRLLGLALVLAMLGATVARADSFFDFKVDRFEIDTSSGGAFVDEFDRQFSWSIPYGTAIQANGLMHLTSPGTPLVGAFGVLPGKTLDVSAVQQPFFAQLTPNDSFVVRSYWMPDPLAFGDFNHMSLIGSGPAGETLVLGLALTNPTPAGQPTMYQLNQHLVGVGSSVTAQFANVPIDPASITGEIVFSVAFDKRSRMVQTMFSLDGGTTFQAPFDPLPFFPDTFSTSVILGADPLPDTVRPAVPLCAGGVPITGGSAVLKRRGRGSLVIRGTFPEFPFAYGLPVSPDGGFQLRLTDPTSGAAFLDLTGASAIPGNAHRCSDRDHWLWFPPRGGYRYVNASGALPPDCKGGSAGGVRMLTFRDHRKKKIVAFEAALQAPAADLPRDLAATLVMGTAPIVSATGRCATMNLQCSTSRTTTRCQ